MSSDSALSCCYSYLGSEYQGSDLVEQQEMLLVHPLVEHCPVSLVLPWQGLAFSSIYTLSSSHSTRTVASLCMIPRCDLLSHCESCWIASLRDVVPHLIPILLWHHSEVLAFLDFQHLNSVLPSRP
jgi:hypothetical protein